MVVREKVIDARRANALFPDANASPEALATIGQLAADATHLPAIMADCFQRFVNRELEWFKRHQKGLWVGGEAVLSPKDLTFAPNDINEAMHSAPDQLKWSVSLLQITAVQVRRGIITDIIDIHSHSGSLSFRCFKAKAFAAEIENARVAQRLNTIG